MGDPTMVNGTSSNGGTPPSFWQRVTLTQVAVATAITALILLGIGLIIALRYVLLLLFLGIVVATALAPIVDRLRRWRASPGLATLLAFALLIVLLAGVIAAVVPFVIEQVAQVLIDLPARYNSVRETLAASRSGLIRNLGEVLDEKKRLAGLAREKSEELAEIEKSQQRERAGLVEQQKKRQAVLARLSDRIKAQRREVSKLKRDEKRLAKLIEGLGRIVAKPKRPASSRAQAPALRNERTPDASLAADAFARLKGRLSLPTRGELANRFGTPRQEGGTTWKGVFIRAANGTEVKAIAPGRIVFADWLRGFGNLAIVDHGDGYLSVYGNNESLYKAVGQPVKAGEAIASVGNSGGNPETGLYFELRHLGQPLDPLKWVILR